MNNGAINRAYVDAYDQIDLSNSILDERCCEELMEMDKHEIIVKICERLGTNPANMGIAETIFEDLKFDMARFVIHHEYCKKNSVASQLLLWLDSRTNPAKAQKLSNFINKYLK